MNPLLVRLLELPALLVGWLACLPLALLVPKDPRLVVVIGREDGHFSDNAKYFCLQAWTGEPARTYRVVFLTGDRETARTLQGLRLPALVYPSLSGCWSLLRASTLVVDSVEWVRGARFQLGFRASKVQLWHGVPLKKIELEHFAERLRRAGTAGRLALRIDAAVRSRHPRYDLVLSPSREFTACAFARSFRAARVVEAAYPRNAALAPHGRDALGAGVWVNTDRKLVESLQSARGAGTRLVLYAPTFRIRGANALDPGVVDWPELDRFAGREGLRVVLKLHPLRSGAGRLPELAHVVEYDPRADVYPLLPSIDLLVTDYSSIYFDFLLLDRPIVFFPYDLEQYQAGERDLFFSYAAMTPGPTARQQPELHAAIRAALGPGGDGFTAARATLRTRVFDHPLPDAGRDLWAQIARLSSNGAGGSIEP